MAKPTFLAHRAHLWQGAASIEPTPEKLRSAVRLPGPADYFLGVGLAPRGATEWFFAGSSLPNGPDRTNHNHVHRLVSVWRYPASRHYHA
jgi:hypothetical protein